MRYAIPDSFKRLQRTLEQAREQNLRDMQRTAEYDAVDALIDPKNAPVRIRLGAKLRDASER